MHPQDDEVFTTNQPKPRIPVEFYRKSPLGAAGLVAFMLAMFILPTIANYWLYTVCSWPLWSRIVLSLPLFMAAGQGVHLMGWIAHDGFHFTWHQNRYACALPALFFSSMTLMFFESGMAMDHWSHHRFANTEDDPDLRLLRHHRSFVKRLFAQRNRANGHYFRRSLGLALGRPLPPQLQKIRLPFSLPVFRVFARLNLLFVLGWATVYILVETRFPHFLLVGVLGPLLAGGWLSGLRSFTEHADTGIGDLHNTRSRTHWLFTFMEYGGNYHLEHHLYPSVPQWRLPRLHRWLAANGFYENLPDPSIIDPSLSVYKYTLGRYLYGQKTPQPAPATVPGFANS
jgi:beta-carotene hydroxylase